MCFYFGEDAVGVRYHPQTSPLPRVTAKASGAKARVLRNTIKEKGFAELASKSITQSCMTVAPGGGVKREVFEDLAQAMNKMFEKRK
jgi:type III secretory pathway component EscU